VEYEETFSPVSRYDFVRAIIYIYLVMRWRIHQTDVKVDFLNEIIDEEVHIEQP
jgi:hypothetical protein